MKLAEQYGRYGYRRVTGLLVNEGWHVNHKRVERIWRQEGLKVPQKQPKRRRLWLNDGSCVRLRPQYPGHVWSYDFVQDHTHNGRTFRMLTIIDEFTRECLSIDVDRRLSSDRVLERLTDLFTQRGAPDYIRSDNGPEFTAKKVRRWLGELSVKTLFIEPGSPWENGYVESFNGKLRARGAVEETLQHGATTQRTWLSPPRPGGAPALGSGLRSAQPSTQGCMTGWSEPRFLVHLE
jgi:transposase InsO family protein